jgi:hypothetical protein
LQCNLLRAAATSESGKKKNNRYVMRASDFPNCRCQVRPRRREGVIFSELPATSRDPNSGVAGWAWLTYAFWLT